MSEAHDTAPGTAGTPPGTVDVDALTELVGWLAHADGTGRSDADLISQLDALERVKSACAAAQARLTGRFVTCQAKQARRLEQQGRACQDAGDYDGWVTARDAARAKTLPPDPAGPEGSSRDTSGQDGAGNDRPAGSAWSRRARAAALSSRTGVSAQVGLARHESPARGARLARAAVALTEDLPCTLAALSAGYLSERRAEIIVRATSHLSAEARAVVDAEVIGANTPDPGDPLGTGITGWGDRAVQSRVRACADRLDPAARAARARNDRHVSCRPVPDAMAVVAALLPVEMAVAVYAALLQAAAAAKAAGDPRTRGQVMADTLVERVTGQADADQVDIEVQVVITDRALFHGDHTPAHVPGHGPVPAGWVRDLLTRDLHHHDEHDDTADTTRTSASTTTDNATDATTGPDTGPPPETGPPRDDGAARPPTEAPARQGEGTHPATDDEPRADTRGPGEEGPDRDDADAPNRAAGSPRAARTWLRRLYTHPGTGTLVAMDSTRRLFPAGLRRYLITRDGTCRTAWCDAPIGHADHIHPHATGGPTNATNGQGLSIGCNLTKDLPGWHTELIDPGPTTGSDHPHTVRITTPTGHTYTSAAPPLLPGHHEPHEHGHGPDGSTPRAVVIELYPARPGQTPIKVDCHHLAG